MLDFPLWKKIWFWFLTLAASAAALPSIFSLAGLPWPAFLLSPVVNLGLDLAGGSHLLLEADPNEVRQQRLQSMEENVRSRLRQSKPRIAIGEISTRGGQLSFLLENPAQMDAARDEILSLTYGVGLSGKRDWDIKVVDGNRFILAPTSEGINQAVDQAMETAVEIVRKRINALGTREPTIIRQGTNRIVVQVPGMQDPAALKELLGQTAHLEFKLVDVTAQAADVAAGIAPPGSEIVPFADPQQGSIAVHRLGGIRGDQLVNAQQSFEQSSNQPVVSITFNREGGEQFAKLTTKNVNRPFAIILDGKVLSAPNINEPILGGSAQISGNFTVDSANQLAISLRSGALPVDLKVVEERTVGPDLGADSIRKGVIAVLVGTVTLVVFIMATYGHFGIYVNLALMFNVLMILGIMAIFNATLTLPGIAGFVLTIGTAVDAYVLINERIREELARGKRAFSAVEAGYQEASRAIFDANLTNVIAALIMFMIGSGPVKGFAVVLTIGIMTSVYTAVTMTRMWVAGWLRRTRPATIHL